MTRQSLVILCCSLAAAFAVVASLVAARLWVLIPYSLPTSGMEPSVSKDAYFFVFQLAYRRQSDVHRGDIVAYRVEFMGKRETYLKRVIGLPGERITIRGDRVFINGTELAHRLLSEAPDKRVIEESDGAAAYLIQLVHGEHRPPDVELSVPDGSFFVMGDNRLNSLDSRYTGCVRFEDIVGEKL